MKVVAADSGAAFLNARFEPTKIVAVSAVLVEPPYRQASVSLVEPIFASVESGHNLIVHELELCQTMLKTVQADIVHLDMSMGGLPVEEVSPIELRGRARSSILKILPRIRKLATDIKRVHGVDVLAIGKESIPVRIAELTTGAHAVIYACQKVLKEEKEQALGLPSKCTALCTQDSVALQSLIAAEHDVTGHAEDSDRLLGQVRIREILNPCARGFRALVITPRRSD